MSSEWDSAELGSLTVNLDTRRKPVKEADRKPGPYPYYGASGIVDYVDGFLFEGEHLLIAEDGENLRTRQTPIAFIANGKFWVNNHAHIVTGNARASTRFLQYALLASDISAYLTGAVMPKLTQGNLNRIEVPCPPRHIQDQIVGVLGALDDRITLLRETNATLEAIAQALFKSWFVDFDPVRAKMEGRTPEGMDEATAALFPDGFETSEFGEVPRGWMYCSLKEVCSIFDSKRVPLSGAERAKRRGPYPYYGAAALMDHVDEYLFDGIYLLTGEDGSVADEQGFPITQYVWGKFWVNNHAHILQGKAGFSTEHLALALRRVNIQPYITGAVQAKLSQSNMWRINVLHPGQGLSEAFGALIAPLYEAVRANVDQVQTLSFLRDTLLPRLISGQLRLDESAGAIHA